VTPLRQAISRSLIVCFREDVDQLEATLASSGLHPQILRASYTPSEVAYPAATRTFMGHRRAWQIAAEAPGYTLICEADFVPCRGLGELPVFWPKGNPMAWAYLYQGSPRLLAVVGPQQYLRGHCAPLVAYVVNSHVAECMLRFFDCTIEEFGTETYFTWDAHLPWWLMGQGAEAYIPRKHYGEHGGSPNPEHAQSGVVTRAGRHRADNLAGPLAFLPQYAGGSWLNYRRERAVARALGWARLCTGRWISYTDVYPRSLQSTARMYWIGLCRLSPSGYGRPVRAHGNTTSIAQRKDSPLPEAISREGRTE
jgi:hypothetical protein